MDGSGYSFPTEDCPARPPAVPQILRGHTWHGRTATPAGRAGPEGIRNGFRYGVTFVLIDPEAPAPPTRLFARNRRALTALNDRDHGGPPHRGQGAAWAREALAGAGIHPARLRLLAQPAFLGFTFNPVSFWLAEDAAGGLRAVIAEVTNTYGDRHAYLCHRPDFAPVTGADELTAAKRLHVSPFQPIEGAYAFRFDIRPDRIGIRIAFGGEKGGVVATLTGGLAPLTDRRILSACLRQPFGTLRVLALIHWQALKLWRRGVPFRHRPAPPEAALSGPSAHGDETTKRDTCRSGQAGVTG